MSNIFNTDFRDFITCLNQAEVRYILVGGYSVIIHGYSRTTGDMDIWVDKTEANYLKLTKAFLSFQMPIFDMTLHNFLGQEMDVFRFGVPPARIDLMTNVLGLSFNDTFEKSVLYSEEDLTIRVIHVNDLIRAKKASGRHRDLNDIENLKPE